MLRQKICILYDNLFNLCCKLNAAETEKNNANTRLQSKQQQLSQQRRHEYDQVQQELALIDWNEWFLLEVNSEHLQHLIQRNHFCPSILIEQTLAHINNDNDIDDDEGENSIGRQLEYNKQSNALQTLNAILNGVYGCKLQSRAEFVGMLTSLQEADHLFTVSATSICNTIISNNINNRE